MLRTSRPVRGLMTGLAALACAFAAGCGDEAKRDAAHAKPQAAKVNLEQFLMQAGEEPGFTPVELPRVDSALDSFGLSAAGVERLRRSGFSATTFQPIAGDDGSGGVSNVRLFKTEAGARAWMEYETSEKTIRSQGLGVVFRRFTVEGLPGARGWTGRDRHGNRIGHVFWVQGRCMLVLGNEGESPFVRRLSTGAKAIYERTKGACP